MLSVIFILAILVSVQWYFTVALICIFLMINAVEHPLCLLAILIPYLVHVQICCPPFFELGLNWNSLEM